MNLIAPCPSASYIVFIPCICCSLRLIIPKSMKMSCHSYNSAQGAKHVSIMVGCSELKATLALITGGLVIMAPLCAALGGAGFNPAVAMSFTAAGKESIFVTLPRVVCTQQALDRSYIPMMPSPAHRRVFTAYMHRCPVNDVILSSNQGDIRGCNVRNVICCWHSQLFQALGSVIAGHAAIFVRGAA